VNNGNNSIGRITTSGVMTTYRDPGMALLNANVISGPDGALWFANGTNTYFSITTCRGNFFIGRITTSGALSTTRTRASSYQVTSPLALTVLCGSALVDAAESPHPRSDDDLGGDYH
jgi:hypothetical protein